MMNERAKAERPTVKGMELSCDPKETGPGRQGRNDRCNDRNNCTVTKKVL